MNHINFIKFILSTSLLSLHLLNFKTLKENGNFIVEEKQMQLIIYSICKKTVEGN